MRIDSGSTEADRGALQSASVASLKRTQTAPLQSPLQSEPRRNTPTAADGSASVEIATDLHLSPSRTLKRTAARFSAAAVPDPHCETEASSPPPSLEGGNDASVDAWVLMGEKP